MPTGLSDIKVTVEDFEAVDWQSITADAPDRDCSNYQTLFVTGAKEAEAQGDSRRANVLWLLSAVTSLALQPRAKDGPLVPSVIFPTYTSPTVADFTPDQLTTLREVAPSVNDAELRARVADLVWLGHRKGSYQTAVLALDSYVESAQTREGDWRLTQMAIRFQRAADLARSLGPDTEHVERVRKAVEDWLGKLPPDDTSWTAAHLMDVLLSLGGGDGVKYSGLCERAAVSAEHRGETGTARRYWLLKAEWHKREGDVEAEQAALAAAAETHVQDADAELSKPEPSYMRAVHHLGSALGALRKIPGTSARVIEVHRRLLDSQQKSLKELKPIGFEVDIQDFIDEARNKVAGRSFEEALTLMCLIHHSRSVADLRADEEKASQNSLAALLHDTVVDERGRTAAIGADLMSSDSEEAKRALEQRMFRTARTSQEFAGQAFVNPARLQILREHAVTEQDFLRLVQFSGFVPADREAQYARGLHAGMQADYVTALPILIPQLENSLRYILAQHGGITSSLNEKGIQEEHHLPTLLSNAKLAEILGEDIIFDLRGLLTERYGSNYRNRVAHGTVSDSGFHTYVAMYLWWLIMRLALWPLVEQVAPQLDLGTDGPETDEGEESTEE